MTRTLNEIVQAGDPVLRVVAAPITQLGTPELRALVARMTVAMQETNGVGLAAPQIGVSKRVIVVETEESRRARITRTAGVAPSAHAFVNPTLTIVEAEPMTFFEGCLSVSGWVALVPRARTVRLQAFDLDGGEIEWEVSGLPARILQHEVDHLDGVLYVDRMLTRTFCSNEELSKHWSDASAEDVRKAMGA